MISSRKILWQFDIILDSTSRIRTPLTPKILAEISLPHAYQLQLRQYLDVLETPNSGGVSVSGRTGYDVLLLKGSVPFPIGTAKIDDKFDQPDSAQCALRPCPPATIIVGKPLKLVVVQPAMELRVSKVKLILTVHMDPNLMLPEKSIPVQTHLDKISSLLESGQFADCKVISRDGEEFACHKAILSLKSAVIQTAFEVENMIEAKSGRIELDCDCGVVKLLLNHFYTGEMPDVLFENFVEIYGAAHLYQIESLKTQLNDAMLSNMNEYVGIGNVLKTVAFADKYDLNEFRQFCLQFIIANRVEIFEQPEWKQFRLEQLDLVDRMLMI